MGNILTNSQGKAILAGGNAYEVTAAVDSNIVAGNIKSGVSILGVEGTFGAQEKCVNFYDYDGTLLHAYTAEEALALTSLPANPTHTGLVPQGWTWTLSDIKDCVRAGGDLRIGQMYNTSDGKVHLHIVIDNPSQFPFTLYYYQSHGGAVTVDWGDGNTSVPSSSGNVEVQHTYAATGSYTITLERTNQNATITLGQEAQFTNKFFSGNDPKILKAAELADFLTTPGNSFFELCSEMETLTMPSGITYMARMGRFLDKLKCLVIPNTVTTLGTDYGDLWGNLKLICTIPTSVTAYRSWLAPRKCTADLGTIYLPNLTKLNSISCVKKLIRTGVLTEFSLGDAFPEVVKLQHTPGLNWFPMDIFSKARVIELSEGLTDKFQQQMGCCAEEVVMPSTCTMTSGSGIAGQHLKRIIVKEGAQLQEVSSTFAYNSDHIEYVDLPSSVEKINGGYTFAGFNCQSLKTLIVRATTPPNLTSTNGLNAGVVTIYVPYSADHSVLNAYKAATNWSSMAGQIYELDENGEIPS